MVSDEFVAGSSHDGTGFEKALLQFPKVLLTTPIGVCNERTNNHATFDGGIERFGNFRTVETEDDEIDFSFCLTDRRKKFRPTVARLHDEFHG